MYLCFLFMHTFFPPLTAPQPTMLKARVFTTSRFFKPKENRREEKRAKKKREREIDRKVYSDREEERNCLLVEKVIP